MKKIFIPLVIGIIFIISGCGKRQTDSLVGKWKENSERDVVLELFEDGGFEIHSPDFPKDLDNTGTWEQPNESNLIFTSKSNPTTTNEISISGESFYVVIDYKTNILMEYKRIK